MKVYIDTNCVIYFIENHPLFGPKMIARMSAIRLAKDEIAIGDLATAECLVVPFRDGNAGLEARYRAFFSDPGVQVLNLTHAICEQAAHIRAAYRFKLIDSLHLATALEHGCGLFLTHDAQLARYTAIPVAILT